MEIPSSGQNIEHRIQNLREDAFVIILPVLGIITYLWLLLNIWMVGLKHLTDPMPIISWVGSLILLSSFIFILIAGKQNYRLATSFFVFAMLGAILCAIFTFQSPSTYNLFIIPIIFSGMFLSIPDFKRISVLSTLLLIGSGYIETGTIFSFTLIGFPVLINLIIIVSTWLAVRNFYIALEWTWQGYQQAQKNEGVIRERQAELKRALKSLDNAQYVIGRKNYDLMVARDEALEATRLKQHFVQNISHELRTPLNIITGFSEMMIQTPERYGKSLPSAYQRDMMIIYRNSKHLESLVNDVLELAKIDLVDLKISFESVDIITFIFETTETIRGLVEHNGLSLQVTTGTDLPQVQLDPIRMRQVLLNILNNAIRFTEIGGIFVSVSLDHEDIFISIRDTGVGIPDDQIDNIFEQFYQVDGTTKRIHQGTGLGLSISKAFVELHGGKIWVDSQIDQGSIFYIKLPVSQNTLSALSENQDTQWLYDTQLFSVILVITENHKAISLLSRYLHNCRVLPVIDPLQAKALAQKTQPIAIIIDQQLLPLNEEQLKDLSKEWGLENCSIIAVQLPTVLTTEKIDSDGYLLKPVRRQTLLDTIAQWESQTNNILLIDDDNDYAQLISSMLETSTQGFQIITAYNGDEALIMLERHKPDLILLDLNLPDIPGNRLINKIRANKLWAKLPIVILTGEETYHDSKLIEGAIKIINPKGVKNNEIVNLIQHFVDAYIDKTTIKI